MKTLRLPISKRKAEFLVTEKTKVFPLKLLRMFNPDSREEKKNKTTKQNNDTPFDFGAEVASNLSIISFR